MEKVFRLYAVGQLFGGEQLTNKVF